MKEQTEKLVNILFAVSMALVGICTGVSAVVNLAGVTLPLVAARIMGSVQLLSMGLMIYSTVNKLRSEKKLPVDVKIPTGEKEA